MLVERRAAASAARSNVASTVVLTRRAPVRSHTYTRAGSGSHERAPSAPGSTAIARYSEAMATQSSVSAMTAGLQAIGSRMTAKPSRVPTAKV